MTVVITYLADDNARNRRRARSEMGVTCVGRQKMKLGSKPLI